MQHYSGKQESLETPLTIEELGFSHTTEFIDGAYQLGLHALLEAHTMNSLSHAHVYSAKEKH